ncbi:MAG: Flp pilus assembly complex ATPase component TadA [Nanoarchaeota archaeon]|nr:Flp pilus assembly complex ATPase component TadA [Nanoarchaeota archaeon]MBU1103576.1 Flp pilus assembly complex ATPase component TadA [Nanoarchaeota archaeon]
MESGKKGSFVEDFPELPPLPGEEGEHEYDPSQKVEKRVEKPAEPVQEKPKEVVKEPVAAAKAPAVVKPAAPAAEKVFQMKGEVRKVQRKGSGNVLEKYELVVDGAHVETEIRKDESGITYNLYIPEISAPTSIFLGEIRNELISATTVSMKELTDPSLFSKIKKRFMDDARKLLKEKLPHTEKDVEDFLVGTLMQEMLGLGQIEFLIADPNLEEIVIPSAKEPIRVFYKKYGWLLTNITVEKEEKIINYSNIIARRVGKQITVLSPLLDAHLVTGDRVNAVLYPVNTKGNTITIRKFARDPFTIVDMVNNKTCNLEIAALLWLAIEYEMNVLISGGTGSGKTSFLNACMPFIPPNQRIISIEDTRELMLPDFLYWTPLVTRTPNPEGKGEVSMLDLLVNSLRMRPDRIVLGEMRKEKEAMVLFEAMHTGHSVYSTVHADSAPETISRLINPPLNVPPNLLKAINLNVVMFRDRRRGRRRILQLAEVEAERSGAKANILYRLIADRDEIVRHSESSRFFEDISRNTGMSQTEIQEDLKAKQNILTWLIKNNVRSLEEIGKVMNLFYRNKELLLSAIKQNNPGAIFKDWAVKKKNEVLNKKPEGKVLQSSRDKREVISK